MTSTLLINRRRAIVVAVAAVLLPGLAGAATTQSITIPGPKHTVAVASFDVMGAYANASATSAGGPIAADFTTQLQESGCCKTIERDIMAQMITEMDMAKSHVSSGTSAPQPGNILPAQFLIAGSVTALSTADRGGGFSFGSGGSALTLGGSSGSIELDVRMVDTRTGAVVTAFKVHRKISASNVGVTTTAGGAAIGANTFNNTPLGKATQLAIADAVIKIEQALAAQPWRGQVVKFDSGTVWANAGGEGGVSVGDRFSLERVGESLTDPATGEVLKENMVELGVVTITNVEPKIAWGSYQPTITGDPARGDFLVLQPH
ncbi:MAG: CsgG/HfaB family protein [Caulobacterales bacterium]